MFKKIIVINTCSTGHSLTLLMESCIAISLLITLRICSRNCLLSTVTGLDLLLMKITMLNKLELKIWSEPSLFPVRWFGTVFHFLSKHFKKIDSKANWRKNSLKYWKKRTTILEFLILQCNSQNHNMVYFRMKYSLPSCLTLAINHTTN